MPGIAGIIQRAPGSRQEDGLRRMVQRMCHEPADVSGQHQWDQISVGVGWASRPGAASEIKPVWNESKSVCLLFSGEVFPSSDSNGHPGRVIQQYEKRGAGFLEDLNGWFSGLLVDTRTETAILFNDRYGASRIYFHEAEDDFYFASEAGSLLSVLPQTRRLDQQSLAEYFSVGCALQNRSLFQGIRLLPPGSKWIFNREGRLEKHRYFNPETWENQPKLSPAKYGERLREVFGQIAPRYLPASEQVGMSLTGGLDSRMILAWAGAAPGSLPCYTFAGPYRDCADVRIARKLAKVCELPHTTLPVGNDFFGDFASLAERTVYLTDGTMDVSGAVELYVNQKARQIAPVRLTGNYGSEILRSNVAFRPARLDTSLFTPEFTRLISEAEQTYRAEAVGNRLTFIAFKQVPWHHHARKALEQSQLIVRSPFLDNQLVALAYQAPTELATSPQPLMKLIEDGKPALAAISTDRALRQHPVPLLSSLANQWQEFTAKAEYAWDYGMPDWLAKCDRAVKPLHLERLFLGRHKFYHFRIWYRDQLSDYLRACSSDLPATLSCCRAGVVRQLIEEHLSGQQNHTSALHRFLALRLLPITGVER